MVRPQSLQKSKQSRKSINGDTIDNDEIDAEMAELAARFSNLKKR